ncbi:MAG: SDR family oxidoreductase, partial [Gammaproteobacteria bacterium]|nr:SDR family oxidoreductase [Gammaproteobacteria bacterium]
ITGGLGRIGLTLARFLAETGDARLILVSRVGLPPRDEWVTGNTDLDARTRARISAVESIEAAGGEVMVVAADVANAAALAGALDEAEARFGVVDGVFHCAADLTSSFFVTLDTLDRENGAEQFEAKIRGTLVIVEAIDDRPGIEFCVLMSSISTVLGGIGFGAYAAANAVMEAIAARCAAHDSNRRFSAIAWDGWQFDPRDTSAPLAMTPEEGMQALGHALAAIDLPRLVVSTADLDARIAEIAGHGLPTESETEFEPEPVEADAYERPELDQKYVAPRDEVERRIAGIWADLLGLDRVGVHDSFLELGGHSLLATQMLSRLRTELGAEMTLAAVFMAPTVAELADSTRDQMPGTGGTQDEEIERELESLSKAEREALLAEARDEAGGGAG